MKIYGIKNCGSVKKALNWMEDNNIEFEFHDYKKEGVRADKLKEWESKVGWEVLLNKRGTTWRRLDPEVQAGVTDGASARALMEVHTSAIKRPVIETPQGEVLVGFDEDLYAQKIN